LNLIPRKSLIIEDKSIFALDILAQFISVMDLRINDFSFDFNF